MLNTLKLMLIHCELWNNFKPQGGCTWKLINLKNLGWIKALVEFLSLCLKVTDGPQIFQTFKECKHSFIFTSFPPLSLSLLTLLTQPSHHANSQHSPCFGSSSPLGFTIYWLRLRPELHARAFHQWWLSQRKYTVGWRTMHLTMEESGANVSV